MKHIVRHEEGGAVAAELAEPPLRVPPGWVSAGLAGDEERDVFRRALAALEGLAAKHGGAVRGTATGVDLVMLARRVAVLPEAPVDPAGGRGDGGLPDHFPSSVFSITPLARVAGSDLH